MQLFQVGKYRQASHPLIAHVSVSQKKYAEIRQACDVLHSFVGDRADAQTQILERHERPQTRQSAISDCSSPQAQLFQLSERSQWLQGLVVQALVIEKLQNAKFVEATDVLESGVGNLCADDRQLAEALQFANMTHRCIGNGGARQTKRTQVPDRGKLTGSSD